MISLKLKLNYELEKEILRFEPGMEVLAPEGLRKIIYEKLRQGVKMYGASEGISKRRRSRWLR